jgi:hypothetical protein
MRLIPASINSQSLGMKGVLVEKCFSKYRRPGHRREKTFYLLLRHTSFQAVDL